MGRVHFAGSGWEGEREGCAFARLALRPHAPAMFFDGAAHDREAHASAFELGLAVQPLEHLEQLARTFHVEADAVVANEEHVLAVALLRADLDPGDFALAGVLERVAEEI